MVSFTLPIVWDSAFNSNLQRFNSDQIILISKLAFSLFSDSSQTQVEILKKNSPTGHKIHFLCLKKGEIHVYLKDNKEMERQERLGTNKSFCSATHLYFQNNQVYVNRIGRLSLIRPHFSDLEAYSCKVQRMLREVKLTQELSHPHIVPYIASFSFYRANKLMKVYAYEPLFEDDVFFC